MKWHSIKDKIPPADSDEEIIVFIPSAKKYLVVESCIASYDAERLLDKGYDPNMTSWDRKFSHWASIPKVNIGNTIYASERTKPPRSLK